MLALLLMLSAEAGEWATKHQIGVSYFPEGLRYTFKADHHFSLWNSDSILFEDTYIAPGMGVSVTPAYARLGPRVVWAPIAVFEVEASVEGFSYFGTFSGVTDFDDPGTVYDDAAMDAAEAAGRKHAGLGWRTVVSPTLQGRVGPVIIALPGEATSYHMKTPEGATGDYWYEPESDALLAWNDTILFGGALVFYSFKDETEDNRRMTWVGAYYNTQYVMGTEDTTTKVGPMMVIRPGHSKWSPRIAAFTQIYLASRTHELVPPYIAAALVW